ncbi:MAG: ROK family protein [Bacteroidota bacterium]
MKYLWGIDLGGTKVEGVVLSNDDQHDVIIRERIPTEAPKGYQHVLGQIKKLIDQTATQLGSKPEKLGIGTPGTLDPFTGTIKNSNSVVLNGQPFKKDLEALLGIPIMIANDANCFALAEARMGIVPDIAPDAQVVFGVIMGTGVGGGIVVNGKAIYGKQGIAGEWGHNFLDESGGPCYCGKVGCTETIISGPALERYYESISGEALKLKEIVRRHLVQSDEYATETMERLTKFFGLGISKIVNVLDPDVIVLGGGVGNIDLLYTEGVKEAAKHVFDTTGAFRTPIVKPKLGDSAGVFGAAFLVE